MNISFDFLSFSYSNGYDHGVVKQGVYDNILGVLLVGSTFLVGSIKRCIVNLIYKLKLKIFKNYAIFGVKLS